ncbi:MAG TPA: sigma-70 family RNA polymerase sigma factor [Terriglobales bacterium]|jgi:RNA polymerase sigma-70 factor (ECF subfamily)|nr:sigma-70 family RNA polymerase sigma factor [Terriglobales bacterium]
MGAIQKVDEPISDELKLVRAAKAGDISAFEQLVHRYDRNVFRIAQHITQNREDAEDVVQDAFLKSYENLKNFQEQSKFYTWLVRIAVNEALMRLRRRRPERMVSLDEDVKTDEDSMPREVADWSPNPEQLYTQSELHDILTKTIQGLPSSFRTVFVLRDVEGLSTEETAEALDLSIPAVKSRLLRARLQLRERLNKYFKKRKSGDGKK